MSTKERPTNAPSHDVFAVSRKTREDKGRWQKIGGAWAQKDGEGFSVKLEFLPLNPNGDLVDIVIRKWKPKPESDTTEAAAGEG